jgi:hypothetical protein
VLYVEGCPSWQLAVGRLQEAIRELGRRDVRVSARVIATHEQAVAARFRGSPTFQADGRDLFDDPGSGFGLSCRLYPGPAGPAGCPTVAELVRALR